MRNGPACAMKPSARRALIAAWERRLDQEAGQPVFGYRISMRRIIVVQCRLLARHLLGEIPRIPALHAALTVRARGNACSSSPTTLRTGDVGAVF